MENEELKYPEPKSREELLKDFESATVELKVECMICGAAAKRVRFDQDGEPVYRHTHRLFPGVQPHEVIPNGEVPAL